MSGWIQEHDDLKTTTILFTIDRIITAVITAQLDEAARDILQPMFSILDQHEQISLQFGLKVDVDTLLDDLQSPSKGLSAQVDRSLVMRATLGRGKTRTGLQGTAKSGGLNFTFSETKFPDHTASYGSQDLHV
ncbi:uncharacterized protein STEHIDRAFT_161136 [Stereum hirsutum FP-91666 SS1]|uniref:uncharacterized protein n=1 Tax=Stereum hirsutum (strain FP-91666) TaxID=721885 RepID=UPI0004449A32|nr:uncharacterized protein STEHIDRAFT_161136 [Stereum hirsutum FP-91666 SS1]EIM82607.1 hypothetical protein STEHIDRAFT_161136 [Stereum hirsutum FP-91666 SS1]